MVLKAMPTGRANARPMTGSASSGDGAAAKFTQAAYTCLRAPPHHEGLVTQLY